MGALTAHWFLKNLNPEKSPLHCIIGSDHAGWQLKQNLIKDHPLINFEDVGCYDSNSCDYPDVAKNVAKKMLALSKASCSPMGVLICGSGVGMSIAANRFPHIRAALLHTAESAKLSREHNDSNVLCLAAKVTPYQDVKEIFFAFLNTAPSSLERHQRRIKKLGQL